MRKISFYLAAMAAGIVCFGVGIFGTTSVSATEAADMAVDVATETTTIDMGQWVETDNGRMYFYADGSYATGSVVIDDVAYQFDYDGYQKTGWRTIGGARWYFDPETGQSLTGWVEVGDFRYYIDPEEGKQCGVIDLDGVIYVLDEDLGHQILEWVKVDDNWHYYDPETGKAAIGAIKIGRVSYMFDYTGTEKTGFRTIEGVRYYYDVQTGQSVTGWVEEAGERYYLTSVQGKVKGETVVDGVRYSLDSQYGNQERGFVTFKSGKTSYFYDDGTEAEGWTTIKGSKYYFDEQYMATGLYTIGEDKYYFGSDGTMRTGWQTIDGEKYYFGNSGVMRTGWRTIDGKKYYFGNNGKMRTGWRTIVDDTYYFGTDGVMRTGWQKIDGHKYYLGNNGKMRTGWHTIDGDKYYFGVNGQMMTGWINPDGDYYYLRSNGKLKTFTYGKNNMSLAYYSLMHVGDPYWYNTYGQIATASLYASNKAIVPQYYDYDDFASQYGQQVFDCTGLIKGFLWSSSVTGAPVYNASQAVNAQGMFNVCKSAGRGKISSFPYRIGTLVFKGDTTSSVHHVGVYVGNDLVVEAKGHEYGVIISKFSTGGWNYWGQCPWISDNGLVDKG